MKLRTDVSPEKLRGGYYTPPGLVTFCWNRVLRLTNDRRLNVLEPSAGDGGFFTHASPEVLGRIAHVRAIEVDPSEAAKCQAELERLAITHDVRDLSFIEWALDDSSEAFDAAIGNPPFVRYQFISPTDSSRFEALGAKLGIHIDGVSNLWMPILLGAISKVRLGGAASFVVPAEIFTGMSAGAVRRWILQNTTEITIDLFLPGSFPDVLQEIVVITARRCEVDSGDRRVTLVQHGALDEQSWSHVVSASNVSWTKLLLTPSQSGAFEEVSALPMFRPLAKVARMQVAVVTGANDFFCVDSETLRAYGLERWALPLLPRVRHVSGLIWRKREQAALEDRTRTWLLHFSKDEPSPLKLKRPTEYLELGMELGIPERYKCRIRNPWFRVPDVWPGSLLLSKRSHWHPRLVLNQAKSLTTDTIYRGAMTADYRGRERDLVAGFHNTITLLSSELEGRSFGGGVHELVPSEIGRLLVPMIPGLGKHLADLDSLARRSASTGDQEELICATDSSLLASNTGLGRAVLDSLAAARESLLMRRLARSAPPDAGDVEPRELIAV